ncbi:MAG TPA: 5-formyltetrahydrofolate cyclo-ligase [Phycisphaerae bacterium]|nr:5-formyltetrahydrofolate cyclo-ligase [Phycisphaerae bacterium]
MPPNLFVARQGIVTVKQALRRQMKEMLAAMPAIIMSEKSRVSAGKIISLEVFQADNPILLYMPLPGEPDTKQIALEAWKNGRTVAMPKIVSSSDGLMNAVKCSSLDDVEIGPFGILAPASNDVIAPEEIGFVVVPALAYDRRGGRLGRGGGFYDRFLARMDARAAKCGLAFSEQIVDELPTDEHDETVDLIVTDEEILWCK